jgi:Rieske Fe-S protein
MSDPTPTWRKDFPVSQPAEHGVSRRQFFKFACCSAVAVTAGLAAKDRLFSPPKATDSLRVASADEIPVGGYKLLRYPTEQHPCILVRLSESEYAAYSQSCTHLQCPVYYRHEARQFHCPCHEGFFSAEDGRVLAGPPPRPLPRYPTEIRDGAIWIVPA